MIAEKHEFNKTRPYKVSVPYRGISFLYKSINASAYGQDSAISGYFACSSSSSSAQADHVASSIILSEKR